MEIPNRAQHAADFAADIARLTESQRRRLMRLVGNPPDLTRVPPDFWREAREEYEREVAAALLFLLLIAMEFHGFDAPSADIAAQRLAEARAEYVADKFIERARRAIAEARMARDATPESIQQAIDGAFSPSSAAHVGTNETTWAQTTGGEFAVTVTVGTSQDDLWKNNPGDSASGPCPTCETLNMTPRSFWERFFPNGPPAPHPGCVCEIVYVNLNVPGPVAAGTP